MVCLVAVGIFIADDSSADPVDEYTFSYNGIVVSQTACSEDSENALLWITYSVDSGMKTYSVGYTLDGSAAIVGRNIDGNTVKCVSGDYDVLVIPPVIKYKGSTYTVNKLGSNIFGTSYGDTSTTDNKVEKFILAAETTTQITSYARAFNNCIALTEASIYGKFVGKAGNGGSLFYMCKNLERVNFGEVTFLSQLGAGDGLVFYGAKSLGNAPESSSLTVTLKSILESNKPKTGIPMLVNESYPDFQVILCLSEGSKQINSLNKDNLTEVQVKSGDIFGSSAPSFGTKLAKSRPGITTNTPIVTLHNFPTVTNYQKEDGILTSIVETYTHIFVSGDETVSTLTFTYADIGSKVMPSAPDKEHYTATWDTASFSLANKVIRQIPVAYTFTFTGADAAVDPISFTVEDINTKSLPAVPARDYYTAAWSVDALSLQNLEVTASYTPITYTFTFTGADAAVDPISFTVEDINTKSLPAVPARDGYEVKWDTTSFTLENKTVYVIYTKLVSVDENGSAEVVLSNEDSSFKLALGTKTVTVEMSTNTSVKVEDAKDLAEKVVVSKVEIVTNDTGVSGTAYEFTFTADGTVYNGKIQVTLPYTKENGKEPVVYYRNGSESVKMKIVSSTDTSVTFETEHNSLYIVTSEISPKEDGTSFLLYFGLLAVAGICVAALVGFTFYRRKA